MFITYILKNDKTSKYYIGCTNSLERRIEEHRRGHTLSTRRKGNWIVIYKEEFKTRIEAIRRERKIKSYKGGNAFKKLIAGVVYR